MSPLAQGIQSGILNGGTSQFCEEGVCRKGFTEAVKQSGLCSSTFVGSVCYGQDGGFILHLYHGDHSG